MEILVIFINSLKSINIWTVVDILVVSYIFYKIYMLIKETRAAQLLKGVLLIFLLIPISNMFHLTVLNWILSNTITIGLLSFVIIFQPEIRRALEHIGRSTFNEKHIIESDENIGSTVNEIINAVDSMSKTKTGALIVFEQTTGLGEYIATGTTIDAIVTSGLLENIFVVNTPLHDGAVIIRNNRIVAAGCFLPLSCNTTINKKLGTRHRAGIGISEISDCLTIIVSEETGMISLAVNGHLTRNYTKDRLKDVLIKIIKNRRSKKVSLGKRVKSWIEKARAKVKS